MTNYPTDLFPEAGGPTGSPTLLSLSLALVFKWEKLNDFAENRELEGAVDCIRRGSYLPRPFLTSEFTYLLISLPSSSQCSTSFSATNQW